MKTLALIIWMILTLVLVASIIGMLLLLPKDRYINATNVPSTWNTIGIKLLNSIIKN